MDIHRTDTLYYWPETGCDRCALARGSFICATLAAEIVTPKAYVPIRGVDMPVESTPKIATHAARSRCVCIIVLGKQALQEK
jgi:hypothetical protein